MTEFIANGPAGADLPRRNARGMYSGARVRGVVRDYVYEAGRDPDPATDSVCILVIESDFEGMPPDEGIWVTMPEPRDRDLCVRDLALGSADGGLEPVPEGGTVTFEGCSRTERGDIEAASYDLGSILRPEPAPSP